MSNTPLRLKCKSPEDVEVVSGLLQDALVRVRDLTYIPEQKRFVAVLNRFRWELSPESNAIPEGEDAAFEDAEADGTGMRQRIHCGLCFEKIASVRAKNFPKDDPERFLNLLSIIAGPESATLLFADKISVQVQYKKLALYQEDLGQAWPTGWQPSHGGI